MNSIPVSSNIFAKTDSIKTNKHAVAFNWEKKKKQVKNDQWRLELE